MSEFYKKYKSIKDSFNVFYKGYDMKSIMAHQFLMCSYGLVDLNVNIRHFWRFLFHGLSFSEIVSNDLSKERVLFTMSFSRADSIRYVKRIIETVDGADLIEAIKSEKRVFYFKNIILSFFDIFFFNFKKIDISIKEKIYLYIQLVYYKNSINILIENFVKTSDIAYVSFFSVSSVDSIIIQFFRSRGITTYGLQHGLHLPASYYKDSIPLDVFNIDNFHADYFLAWGSCMRKIFSEGGIEEEKVLIAGNPSYSDDNNTVQNHQFLRGILCLGRSIYYKDNIDLINIAIQLSDRIKFAIKLHPLDSWENYKDFVNDCCIEVLDVNLGVKNSVEYFNPDFVVVINSTVYYEYYMLGVQAFRFRCVRDLPIGLEDIFNTYEEFLELIEKTSRVSNSVLNFTVKKMLNDVFAIGENNYNSILNKRVSK